MSNTTKIETYPLPQPKLLKALGRFLSYLFHPLFIPLYVSAYLIFLHPYTFAMYDEKQKVIRLLSIFVISTFFPAFTVFLLWRLGFSTSIFLKTQKERIIPYVSSIIYFFWAFYVNKNMPGAPQTLTSFFLGVFLTLSAALMANNYFKISMHALAVGGAACYFILLSLSNPETGGLPVSVAVILAGFVCTARLLVSDHRPFEIYWGIFLGVIGQSVAALFIL